MKHSKFFDVKFALFFFFFPHSYSVAGMIAILEFYFARFLYVCLGSIDVGLGTASVNIIIGLNQVSGLLGGVLADRVLGQFWLAQYTNYNQLLSSKVYSRCCFPVIL